jgi:hypothetical protein
MKTIYSVVSITVLASAILLGCNTPEKAQESADQARRTADDKALVAQKEAEQQRLLGEANIKQKQDQADLVLTTAKNDYRAKITAQLIDLDKKADDLAAKNPHGGTESDDKLTTINAKRTILKLDLKQIDGATALGWDSVKDQVGKDLTDVKLTIAPVVGKI